VACSKKPSEVSGVNYFFRTGTSNCRPSQKEAARAARMATKVEAGVKRLITLNSQCINEIGIYKNDKRLIHHRRSLLATVRQSP